MAKTSPTEVARNKRKLRIQKRVRGDAARPRLSVFCSGRHIYAQIINDEVGHTLAAASTLKMADADTGLNRSNIKFAQAVGKQIAEAALASAIRQVVFDRNGRLYHGRVKALADAAREAGLDF